MKCKLIEGTEGNLAPVNLKMGGKYYTGKGSVIEPGMPTRTEFFRLILECVNKTIVTGNNGEMSLEKGLAFAEKRFRKAHAKGGKLIFIGNGGSAAIASHMATDYSKNGGIRAVAFNDAPTLTCLANDFGYDQVFAKQIEYYAFANDVVVIVSSSGRSLNINAAADECRVKGCDMLVTLSGMNPNNILRAKGDLNFYVPSSDYGLVEIAHLALLHSIVNVR